MRLNNLQSVDVLSSTLRGLGARAHEVNLELMVELLDEARGVVDHPDVTISSLAVICCFLLLSGPSASLTLDVAWLEQAVVNVIQRSLAVLWRTTNDGKWPDKNPKEQDCLASMIMKMVGEYLGCKQLHQKSAGGASQAGLSRLLHALMETSLNADAHVAMAAMKMFQQVLAKFPRQGSLFDPEGVLLPSEGSLGKDVLSVHWHAESLKYHISPISSICRESMIKTAKRIKKRDNEQDPFTVLVGDTKQWFRQEPPSESYIEGCAVWPWAFLDPPLPEKVPEKLKPGNKLPFVTPQEIENISSLKIANGTKKTAVKKKKIKKGNKKIKKKKVSA